VPLKRKAPSETLLNPGILSETIFKPDERIVLL
jgi:hypothetical protein